MEGVVLPGLESLFGRYRRRQTLVSVARGPLAELNAPVSSSCETADLAAERLRRLHESNVRDSVLGS